MSSRGEGHTLRNHYLEGNYAPVRDEHTVTELAVTGTIPAHLDGRYLRNGPNPIADVDPQTYHWFTGDGMVHGVRLRDGKAYWYRNRWIRTPAVARRLGEAEPRSAPIRMGLELLGANYQRCQPCRPDACLGGRRNRELGAHRGPGHCRPVRLRRHRARWVHRASQA